MWVVSETVFHSLSWLQNPLSIITLHIISSQEQDSTGTLWYSSPFEMSQVQLKQGRERSKT